MNRFNRRQLLAGSLAGAMFGEFQTSSAPAGRTARRIFDAIKDAPVSDVHCHAFEALTPLTESQFLEELSLPAFMLSAYFPAGIYQQWKGGDPDTRKRLDAQYQIQKKVDEVNYHFSQTVFLKHLTNELAAFFRCKPTLKDVVAARNERGKDFWGYANALLKDAGFTALLIDTGYRYNRINLKDFASKLSAKIHLVFRLETAITPLLNENITLDELTSRFIGRLRQELDSGHIGFKSYIASTGLDVKPWPRCEVEKAWAEYKATPAAQRQGPVMFSKIVREHLLWQALDLAYERDVPVQIHCGNGEGPGVYLSHQYPYNLENVVRYPVTTPQKPVKVIMVHGGYPHVDEAAYMSHIFTNVYYDISLMSPLVSRGLHARLLDIFESAPLSKILHGSDAYNLPEFYYA
ncbi:MAG: amidohydrolase family protein, partial [Acidobacteria bacterium]|nr:amidohydrolase family protein [Acidobacteriota bacterium]